MLAWKWEKVGEAARQRKLGRTRKRRTRQQGTMTHLLRLIRIVVNVYLDELHIRVLRR